MKYISQNEKRKQMKMKEKEKNRKGEGFIKLSHYSEFMFLGSEDDYEQIVELNKSAVWLTASKHLKNRNDIEDIGDKIYEGCLHVHIQA